MFQKNEAHLQQPLYSTLDELPTKLKKRLEKSWAEAFYHGFFRQINEALFEVLYAEADSRPNVPVNVLVGLEVLKAGNGWTDEEMYEAFCYNLQVRYALGYRSLGEGQFELRTMYNFRQRLAKHMQESGENLIGKVFEDVTDKQLRTLELKTGKMRMDSTQVASNIQNGSRLQLLVEVLQRVHRLLSEEAQAEYEALFASYVKGKANHYVYRLQGNYQDHIQKIGEVMAQLVVDLAEGYEEEPAYQVLKRVFEEHFVWTEEEQRPKQGQELSADSLQSPDDMEASYRKKREEKYVGYVVNVTETCEPENDLQLIVHMQTESNVKDDAAMLAEALPELIERYDVKEINTDGGYNSEDVDELMRDQKVVQNQTAIRGGAPSPDRVGLADFIIDTNKQAHLEQLTCPGGQTTTVEPGQKPGRFILRFDAEQCAECPLRDLCTVPPKKPSGKAVLYLGQRQVDVALKRQRLLTQQQSGQNIRSAVEATVRSVKHPFRGKLPVRGKFRMASMLLASALMVNVRRIHAYGMRKQADNQQLSPVFDHSQRLTPFLRPRDGLYRHLWAKCRRWLPVPSADYAIVCS
jgi:hypothetical protein